MELAANAVVVVLTWMLSNHSIFKKYTMTKDKIRGVMRALSIYVILLVVVTSLLNIKDVKRNIDEDVAEEQAEIKLKENLTYISVLHSDEENAAHEQEIQAQLQDVRDLADKTMVMVIIVSFVVQLLINFLHSYVM